jgi:hypothetical protein
VLCARTHTCAALCVRVCVGGWRGGEAGGGRRTIVNSRNDSQSSRCAHVSRLAAMSYASSSGSASTRCAPPPVAVAAAAAAVPAMGLPSGATTSTVCPQPQATLETCHESDSQFPGCLSCQLLRGCLAHAARRAGSRAQGAAPGQDGRQRAPTNQPPPQNQTPNQHINTPNTISVTFMSITIRTPDWEWQTHAFR